MRPRSETTTQAARSVPGTDADVVSCRNSDPTGSTFAFAKFSHCVGKLLRSLPVTNNVLKGREVRDLDFCINRAMSILQAVSVRWILLARHEVTAAVREIIHSLLLVYYGALLNVSTRA